MHRADHIRLLALDVDGVLTDGSIMLDDQGVELKRFNARDGFGITLWKRAGFECAIITRRTGQALQHRMRELGVELVVQGSTDKGAAIQELSRRASVAPGEMAFVGDDWPDLAAMRLVGYPIAVADADPAVISAAAWVTQRPGGRGAVRDAVDHLLDARGLRRELLRHYDPHA